MIVAVLTLGIRGAIADPTVVETPPPQTIPQASPKTVQLKGDRLTVRVSGTPLSVVLQEVVAPSNGEIRGSVKEPRDVTVDFENVPLRDGLTRLLGDQNFVITYRQNGTLRALTLLGGPQEPVAPTAVMKATAHGTPQAPVQTAAELLERNVPVPAGSRLAQFVGQQSASLQQLLDITLRQEDRGLRQEALRAGLVAIDTQQDLRAAVVKAMSEADEGALESMFRSLARDRAHEIASQVAALSKTPEIRTRGLRLVRRLNAGDTTQ